MKHFKIHQSQEDYEEYIDIKKADEIGYPRVDWVEGNEKCTYLGSKPPHDYSKDYLTFEALEDGTFTIKIPAPVNSEYMTSISYSVDDGETWTTTNVDSTTQTITTPTITQGNKVLWKGVCKQMAKSSSNNNFSYFSSTGNFNVSGNIMSLLYGDEFANQVTFTSGSTYNFAKLFVNSNKLISASNMILPATTLANYCYYYMFNGCTALTIAPELPATALAASCYQGMFQGCTSLTTTPELPATTLASSCYHYMFSGTNVLPDCTNIDFTSQTVVASGGLQGLFGGTKVTYSDLNNILPINGDNKPCLPVATLTNYCYKNMFNGCTSLTSAPELPATTLANSCYGYMFQGCTSLTTAPELPATTLADYCYMTMFYGCTSLTTAPALNAKTLAAYCYGYMFEGCTALTTAPELPATTLADCCYSNMFLGCTSLTTAPVLPATTLVSSCYYQMFFGCSNLNYIKAMFTTTPSTSYTAYWVYGVAATGTFVKNSAATWTTTGVNEIPTGWTVQTASA